MNKNSADYHLIKKDTEIEFKKDFSTIDLLAVKYFIENQFKKKGKISYEYSFYTSNNDGEIHFDHSIGTTNQITIMDHDGNYHILETIKISVNEVMFIITPEEEIIKVELESLTN